MLYDAYAVDALENGSFTSPAGAWVGARDTGAGNGACANGQPNIGTWEPQGLFFSYIQSSVSQQVVISVPSTVLLTYQARNRGDVPQAIAQVSLSDSNETVTSGQWSPPTILTQYGMSVTTTVPNEVITVTISGRDNRGWAGCYGTIFHSASLSLTPAIIPPSPRQYSLMENQSQVITAPEGKQFISASAWYGNPNNQNEGADVSAIVTSIFANQTSATLESNNSLYGDPVPGVVKILLVDFSLGDLPNANNSQSPTDDASPSPTPSPTPIPEPSPTPEPSPSNQPTPEPQPSPQPSPTIPPELPPSEPLPLPTPSPSPQPSPTPQPEPPPVVVPSIPEPTPEPFTPTPNPEPTPTLEELDPTQESTPDPELPPEPQTESDDDSGESNPADSLPSSDEPSDIDDQITNPATDADNDANASLDFANDSSDKDSQPQDPQPQSAIKSNSNLPSDAPLNSGEKPTTTKDSKPLPNGGVEILGTPTQPQVIGEDGQLTPPPPPPGSGLPIDPEAVTVAETFIGQPGGMALNSPDIAEEMVYEPLDLPSLDIVPLLGAGVESLNKAYVALSNIGVDLDPLTRKKAKKIILTAIIAQQTIATTSLSLVRR